MSSWGSWYVFQGESNWGAIPIYCKRENPNYYGVPFAMPKIELILVDSVDLIAKDSPAKLKQAKKLARERCDALNE